MSQIHTIYRMRAIITHGLYMFYPIFHCGLYCRAVYDAERLIFHDSFFHASCNKKYYLTQYFIIKVVVYTAYRFVLQETFLSLKICDL